MSVGRKPACIASAIAALALASSCTVDKPQTRVAWQDSSPARDDELPPAAVQPAGPAARPASPRELDALARKLGSAARCEIAARTVYEQDGPDAGWALLTACVRQGTFFHLARVLSPPWVDEVRKRKNGPLLVAQVIATRGGDVPNDLRMLHKQRIPLFSLSAALARPAVYDGRLLLVRGRALGEPGLPQNAALLEETEVVVRTWPRRSRRTRVVRQAEYEYDEGRSYDDPDHSRSRSVIERSRPYDLEEQNVDVATGRQMVAALPRADPFLVPEEPYLFLVRFRGAEALAAPGQQTDEQAVGEVIAWYQASTAFLE